MINAENSESYRFVFEHAPDGMYVFNAEGNFILVNNHFCKTLGYSREELLQMNIRDTYLESELDLLAERINKLHMQKATIVERSFKRKNGTSFYAQIHLKITDNGCIYGIVREDMLQKSISEQLDDNEERFRQITEHIRDVFFLIDLYTKKFLYISPAYEKIWDQPIANLLEDPTAWTSSIHPDDRERVMPLYYQQIKTGLIDIYYRVLLKEGSIRHIHARTFPIYNKYNQLYRSAGVAEDVTDQMLITQERLDYASNIQLGFNELVVAMSTALEHRDAYTAGHQNKVSYLAKAIAQELNLPPNQVQGIELAAQVHDIGKIGIPIEILTKPIKLSTLEFELMKTHTEAGYDILKGIRFPWPIAEIVLQHHERLDGSGYPRGLTGEKILLEAKIIAIADTVDAMSSHRPYRAALGIQAALEEIQKFSGVLFDKEVVNACQKLFLEKKIELYSRTETKMV
jgi:PAS domain S-box-containing protein